MKYPGFRGKIAGYRQRSQDLNDTAEIRREYLALRDALDGAMLSTRAEDGTPEASYAPILWRDGAAYLFLSELASHTRNLLRDPALGLLLLDPATTSNPFARRRIVLNASAERIERDAELHARMIGEFRRRFGKVMDLLEPLPDFHLFRVVPRRGRYIRGFGQAYDLTGPDFDQPRHVGPGS